MLSQIRPVLVIFSFLAITTGIIYPFVVTGIARAAFAEELR